MTGVVSRLLAPLKASPQLALGVAALLGWVLLLALSGLLQTHDPQLGDLTERFSPAGTAGHLLGTDNLGRDLWSRVLSGLPWSVGVATVSCVLALLVGGTLGLCAAQYQGYPRTIINQLVDATLSFPGLVAAIIIVAVAGRGFWPLSITLGLLSWPVFARVVYAESLRLLAQDYVTAARVMAVSTPRILLGHLLPGLRPVLAVVLTFHFADMLVAESALSFLGLGAPLGVPTWGALLQESRDFLIVAPWLMVVPAAAIALLVVSIHLLGDGLSALDRARR